MPARHAPAPAGGPCAACRPGSSRGAGAHPRSCPTRAWRRCKTWRCRRAAPRPRASSAASWTPPRACYALRVAPRGRLRHGGRRQRSHGRQVRRPWREHAKRAAPQGRHAAVSAAHSARRGATYASASGTDAHCNAATVTPRASHRMAGVTLRTAMRGCAAREGGRQGSRRANTSGRARVYARPTRVASRSVHAAWPQPRSGKYGGGAKRCTSLGLLHSSPPEGHIVCVRAVRTQWRGPLLPAGGHPSPTLCILAPHRALNADAAGKTAALWPNGKRAIDATWCDCQRVTGRITPAAPRWAAGSAAARSAQTLDATAPRRA